MNILRTLVLLSVTLAWFADSQAEVRRDPIGVNVVAAAPMSLTVRFADSNGALFTTTEAVFCYRLLSNGQCDPSAMLGRLPISQDRGSTTTPVSRITDVMTIPYSVIRSTLVRAQNVDFSDFYYVRRFSPVGNADLGAGPGADVYVRVTCHLAGPATVPLSLTRVSLAGYEPEHGRGTKLIRLNDNNLQTGQLRANVNYTGTGILEGWWEVRQPGDPELRDIDLLTEAALSSGQRGQQQRFLRLQRFRVQATTTGHVTIPGPLYRELPRNTSGRHEILLRFDATQGRENRARLAVDGEPLNLFSGAVAGFSLPVIEYINPAGLLDKNARHGLASRLIADVDEHGARIWRLAWQPQSGSGHVIEFVAGTGAGARSLLAPAAKGIVDFPAHWRDKLPQADMSVTLLGKDGRALGQSEKVFQ